MKNELLWMKASWKECESCDMHVPIISHHCSHCRKCIYALDHHCYFLGHCVGRANLRYISFLSASLLTMPQVHLGFLKKAIDVY